MLATICVAFLRGMIESVLIYLEETFFNFGDSILTSLSVRTIFDAVDFSFITP